MRAPLSGWLAVGLFTTAIGCNPFAMWGQASAHKDLSEQATERFHAQLDSAQFEAIYGEADQDFRSTVTERDANALWRMVQRRFGPVQGTALANWHVSFTTGGGTQVRLIYRTAFAQDSAVETITWRIRDGTPRLLGYNINSPALLRAMVDEKD